MDFASSLFVSQENFILFHKIDRDLYTILVTNLSRDPIESMQTLAMWLWLERVGFHNLVKKIISLPIPLINEVVDETLLCLRSCMNNNVPLPTSSSEGNIDIPLLQNLMDKEISLEFFIKNRVIASHGVTKIREEVCVRALSDIMQQAILRNAVERMMEAKNMAVNNFWFGSIVPGGENNIGVLPADERTLFLTFSKGYRVEEWEVREVFTMAYGDCIEALYMQEVPSPKEQPLFARIVFHKLSTIDMILRGATKVKFSINGKHVCARKFVSKPTNATG